MRIEAIDKPEVEHIAPKTENNEKIESGYDPYDEEFKNQFMDCLGNYLLISKTHNCSIGNKPFKDKLSSYDKLKQQEEIRSLTEGNERWTKALIQKRKEKIIQFIMGNF